MADVVAQPSRVGSTYVEWGAIFAGAVLAAGLSFVLLTFSAAIGLSLVSPYASQSYGKAAASVAVLWALVVPIISFLVGGYVTGRLRTPWAPANEAEVEFRDGIHGALVWGLSIAIGGLLTFFAATAAAQTGVRMVSDAPDRGSLIAPAVDTLFRTTVADAGNTGSPAGTTTLPKTTGTASVFSTKPATGAFDRDSATRVLSSAVADGRLKVADRDYLSEVVAQRTGLPPAEAEKRVDQAYAQAQDAADKARRATVAAALVAATGLLLGLAAAWYAAQWGGRHRDENIPARFTWALRSPPRRKTPPLP